MDRLVIETLSFHKKPERFTFQFGDSNVRTRTCKMFLNDRSQVRNPHLHSTLYIYSFPSTHCWVRVATCFFRCRTASQLTFLSLHHLLLLLRMFLLPHRSVECAIPRRYDVYVRVCRHATSASHFSRDVLQRRQHQQ